MTRIFCLTLSVALASRVPIPDREKQDPPKHFTNSIGMKFVWIPPGSFMMGSLKEENKGRLPTETQHKVTLTKGFYLGVHPVTQEQWKTVMSDNPSKHKGESGLPVEKVSWEDCQEFIKKLRGKDNEKYRLPTEAEWEYACRAGTKTAFHFGDTISTDQVNFRDPNRVVNRNKTTPAGGFPMNAWGLYDMHGNVWQWCHDWLGDYPNNDVTDPKGPEKGDARILRGGSYSEGAERCRSACRVISIPEGRSGNCGFRVCFFIESENK